MLVLPSMFYLCSLSQPNHLASSFLSLMDSQLEKMIDVVDGGVWVVDKGLVEFRCKLG
jgi:hypothetical protein